MRRPTVEDNLIAACKLVAFLYLYGTICFVVMMAILMPLIWAAGWGIRWLFGV